MNTKEIIVKSLKSLVADRYLLILVSTLFLVAIIFAVTTSLAIHQSEIQLVSHYSSFGITHIYRDQWFYLISFVLSGIIFTILHIIIAIKLLVVKGRLFAVMFTWLGIGILILGCWTTAMTVINIW